MADLNISDSLQPMILKDCFLHRQHYLGGVGSNPFKSLDRLRPEAAIARVLIRCTHGRCDKWGIGRDHWWIAFKNFRATSTAKSAARSDVAGLLGDCVDDSSGRYSAACLMVAALRGFASSISSSYRLKSLFSAGNTATSMVPSSGSITIIATVAD